MKLKGLICSTALASSLLVTGISTVHAEENSQIPQHVLDKAERKVDEVQFEPEKQGLYKVMPDGSEVKVDDNELKDGEKTMTLKKV